MRSIATPSSLSPVSAAGGALQTLAVRYHGMRDHSYHIMMQNAYAYAESSTWAWEDPREPLAQQGPTGGCTVEPSEPPDKMSWKMHPPCDAAAYAQPPRGGLPLNPRAPVSSRCSGVRTPLHAVFQHSPGPLCAGDTAALIHTGPQHTAFQRTGDRSAQLRSSHCRSTQRSSGQRTAALSSEARIAAAHRAAATAHHTPVRWSKCVRCGKGEAYDVDARAAVRHVLGRMVADLSRHILLQTLSHVLQQQLVMHTYSNCTACFEQVSIDVSGSCRTQSALASSACVQVQDAVRAAPEQQHVGDASERPCQLWSCDGHGDDAGRDAGGRDGHREHGPPSETGATFSDADGCQAAHPSR